MINQEKIKKQAIKTQTSEINIIREYCQNLFLSSLYKQKNSDKILFKGGTALKLIFRSKRFSEDLDFTACNLSVKQIENLIANTLSEIEHQGIKIDLQEANRTIGGYYAEILFYLTEKQIKIELNFVIKKEKIPSETTLIQNEFIPEYLIQNLTPEQLINEKIKALLTRSKPRDFYDLYFLLRTNLVPIKTRKLLKKVLEKTTKTKINFKKELTTFLPKSHQIIIKNFKNTLTNEIKKFV